MLEQATAKLLAEIEANKNNPYIKVIGEFLINHISVGAGPEAAEKVIAADKTIAKSLDAMKEAARKKQSGGMAMLTDAEGFAIVLGYFGIGGKPAVPAAPTIPADPAGTPAASAPDDFATSLDAYL